MGTEDDRDRLLVERAFGTTRRPPSPGFGDRVLAHVRSARRSSTGPAGWGLGLVVAGLAGALAAVIGVASGLLSLPAGGTSPNGARVQPLGTGGPAGSEAPPTFLLAAGGGPAPFLRVDWEGRTTATFSPAAPGGVSASPDGRLAAGRDASGPGASIVDAEGRTLSHVASFGAWSSDGGHAACALDTTAGEPRVVVTDLAAPDRPRQAAHAVPGIGATSGWTLLGCAAGADRLVAARTSGGALAEVAVVQASAGRLLWHRLYPTWMLITDPVVSHDGRYLAENDRDERTAAIRDLTTGELVGRTSGLVTAFSGDDRLVLLDAGARAAIADWRKGAVRWSEAGRAEALAERPAAPDLVIALTPLGGASPRVLLIRDGGRVTELHP
jgi:hypothetical protein